MKTFECPKCHSGDVYSKKSETSNQVGLYCGDCGKWIKWLGKEEQRLVDRYVESRKDK